MSSEEMECRSSCRYGFFSPSEVSEEASELDSVLDAVSADSLFFFSYTCADVNG